MLVAALLAMPVALSAHGHGGGGHMGGGGHHGGMGGGHHGGMSMGGGHRGGMSMGGMSHHHGGMPAGGFSSGGISGMHRGPSIGPGGSFNPGGSFTPGGASGGSLGGHRGFASPSMQLHQGFGGHAGAGLHSGGFPGNSGANFGAMGRPHAPLGAGANAGMAHLHGRPSSPVSGIASHHRSGAATLSGARPVVSGAANALHHRGGAGGLAGVGGTGGRHIQGVGSAGLNALAASRSGVASANNFRPGWAGNGYRPWGSHYNHHGINSHHYGWYHGNWGGRYGFSYYPFLWGLGWGWGWGWGSMGLNSGYYNNYYNPYYGGQYYYPCNYSQPIQVQYLPTPDDDQQAPPPATADQQAAYALFDQARAAFGQQDYLGAMQLLDQTAAKLPNDPVVHEMRALNLFALGRYPESAAVLNSLLATAPGWDWATLVGQYPSVDVFTRQQRALETYRTEHPQEAAPRFVLAYLYLVQGHDDAAKTELTKLLKIQPDDRVAEQMLKGITKPEPEGAAVPATAPARPAEVIPAAPKAPAKTAIAATEDPKAASPADVRPANAVQEAVAGPKEAAAVAETGATAARDEDAAAVQTETGVAAKAETPAAADGLAGASVVKPEAASADPAAVTPVSTGALADVAAPSTDLVGRWTGVRNGATFRVWLSDDGKFTWHAQPEKAAAGATFPELTGVYTVDDGVIVMEDGQGGTMAGRLSSLGKDQFTFTMLGAPEEDSGIAFSREG